MTRPTREMAAVRRALIGRRIVDVELNPFEDGRGDRTSMPDLILDNGARVFFMVDETEGDGYGVRMGIAAGRRRGKG